jgi:hypothetical protein
VREEGKGEEREKTLYHQTIVRNSKLSSSIQPDFTGFQSGISRGGEGAYSGGLKNFLAGAPAVCFRNPDMTHCDKNGHHKTAVTPGSGLRCE